MRKSVLPAAWGHGRPWPSQVPILAVLFAEPKGTILPLGGMDSGHKGYGLSLMVEAMTGGLAGHGRADPAEGWGATVFLQIIDPQAFAGLSAFERQLDHVIERAATIQDLSRQGEKVQLPGRARSATPSTEPIAGLAALSQYHAYPCTLGRKIQCGCTSGGLSFLRI
jgi:LDH2 family malate/lactate/ureidoglycolate dehydrogenase